MSKPATEGRARGSVKKRHLGLAGLITVLMQYGIGTKNEEATQKAFQQVIAEQMRTQKAQLQLEQEKNFVRKAELNSTLSELSKAMVKLADGQAAMNTEVSKIKGYLEAKNRRPWSSIENPGPAQDLSQR
jgi:isopropylmalate/homocitrate/citramalate synthase